MSDGRIKCLNIINEDGFIENNVKGKYVFFHVTTLLFFFIVSLFAITSSFAHQPVLNTGEEMSQSKPYVIKNPEISKAIYSTLNGTNHFYEISNDKPFNFYAGLTVPKIDDCIDFPRFSFTVLDQNFHIIQQLDG